MLSRPLLNQIVRDEALVRGLGDPEARVLVEWLVDQAEERVAAGAEAAEAVRGLCRRARAIGRFVLLWCHAGSRGAAGQLAASERFSWPLPAAAMDPCVLMQNILAWEDHEWRRARRTHEPPIAS
jgi:hypothetical protein